MTEIKLNKKLINFGTYRITNNKNIDSLKEYDLFCFIINDNIYKTEHIVLNKKNIKSFIEANSLYEYIDKNILTIYHHLDKKDFKSYIYCISREQKTKNAYTTLYNMTLKNEIQSSFSYFKFLKDNNIDYKKIGTLFLLIYMSMSYIILSNSGFNIKNLDSLNIIISIIFFQVSSIISILPSSFIIGLFKTLNTYLLIVPILLFIIYQIIKKFNIYYPISFVVHFSKHLFILIIKSIFTLSISIGLLYILYSPLAFSFDNFKFHTKFKDYSNDNEIFKMYLDKTGYPKILYKDGDNGINKKYIFVGIESNNYLVYEVDKVIDYIKDIDSLINQNKNLKSYIPIEQFCRNIDNIDDQTTILYQILKNSTISKPNNIEWINTSNSHIIIKPLKLEELNLNYNEITEKCIKLLNKSDKERNNK